MSANQQMMVGGTYKIVPSVYGQAYGGGFYAGKIVDGGVTYYLIVAPNASGYSIKAFGPNGAALPAATNTTTNGLASSNSMNSATYPAAYFCRGLNIAGFTDWYLPSRDELEILYRNLKGTTSANLVAGAWRSAANMGASGYGLDNQANGVNANSSPTGAAYTSGSPAQTAATDFQGTNAEAFKRNWSPYYYSSTNFDDNNLVWEMDMNDGTQYVNNYYKATIGAIRAVRREAV